MKRSYNTEKIDLAASQTVSPVSLAMAESTRTGWFTITFLAEMDPRPARICPKCNRTGSVSIAKAQKRFISLIPVKSQTVWRCKKCGWNMPITANWEPAVSNSIAAARPSTSHEINPMYRMAEGWYRPPSNLLAGSDQTTPVQLGNIYG
ncbi:hypothetical protein B0H10DRAFT_577552 [Mycena sp. CBHHK59/15]|nr:hypothetical protein B0H10DRAFT_577552 [Mycena sp. CBHHK59/15]